MSPRPAVIFLDQSTAWILTHRMTNKSFSLFNENYSLLFWIITFILFTSITASFWGQYQKTNFFFEHLHQTQHWVELLAEQCSAKRFQIVMSIIWYNRHRNLKKNVAATNSSMKPTVTVDHCWRQIFKLLFTFIFVLLKSSSKKRRYYLGLLKMNASLPKDYRD